jgi:hypothetical protein
VLSDWNGYRETLRHEEEGFLVPTWAAPPGSGEELAQRYLLEEETYDTYIGKAGQLAAVEVAPMAEAFMALGANPDLRQRMGKAGQARVRQLYDWSVIIPQYEALWGELAVRRAKDKESAPLKSGRSAVPPAPDPFTLFAHYPTHALTAKTRVVLALAGQQERIKTLLGFKMNTLAQRLRVNRPGPAGRATRRRARHRLASQARHRSPGKYRHRLLKSGARTAFRRASPIQSDVKAPPYSALTGSPVQASCKVLLAMRPHKAGSAAN